MSATSIDDPALLLLMRRDNRTTTARRGTAAALLLLLTGNASFVPSTIGSDVYLRFLIESGYEPSEVEKVIVGERSADAVYDEAVEQD